MVSETSRAGVESENSHPLMLILSCERPKVCSAILTTTEKASLISKRAISFISRPALFKAIGMARAGASGKSIGLTPTSEKAGEVVNQKGQAMPMGKHTNNSRKRSETKVFGFLCACQYQRGSTVAQRRRVRCRYGTILLEGRPESRDLLKDDPLVLFILFYDGITLLSLDGYRSDLSIVSTVGPGTGSTLVRLNGVSILRLSRNLKFCRSSLSTVPHSEVVVYIPQTVCLQRIPGSEFTKRRVLSRE